MSAQSLLGKLQGALGILDATGLQELEHSLLVSGDSSDLSDDLADELDSLADLALFLYGSGSLGLFGRDLELGDGMPLVLAEGNHCRV